MKLDSLGTLAEVMPFFGTLDQTFVLMNSINIRTKRIWNKCKKKFCKIIKRKFIHIDFNNFCNLMISSDKFLLLFLSIFEVLEIVIKSVDEYCSFTDKIKECEIVEMIKIRDLKVALSTKDDFNCTYQNACSKIVYDNNDRLLDQHYNELVETISKLTLNVECIRSFLYIDEIKNRNISYVDRIVVFLK